MREIKFRAWMEDEMLSHDDLVNMDQETHAMYTILTEPQEDITFMQYTGLKDKNGREIYESDILKDHGDEGPIYVEYSDEHAGFIFVDIFDPSGREVYTPMQISYEAFEVIGNIYRNPELLEENK